MSTKRIVELKKKQAICSIAAYHIVLKHTIIKIKRIFKILLM